MKLDRTSMLYGTLILTGTSIVSQFLGFVYRILLSRLIGAEVMGLYQLIMPVFSVIMALTAVGLTVAVSNLSSQYHARGNRAAIAQVLRRIHSAHIQFSPGQYINGFRMHLSRPMHGCDSLRRYAFFISIL